MEVIAEIEQNIASILGLSRQDLFAPVLVRVPAPRAATVGSFRALLKRRDAVLGGAAALAAAVLALVTITVTLHWPQPSAKTSPLAGPVARELQPQPRIAPEDLLAPQPIAAPAPVVGPVPSLKPALSTAKLEAVRSPSRPISAPARSRLRLPEVQRRPLSPIYRATAQIAPAGRSPTFAARAEPHAEMEQGERIAVPIALVQPSPPEISVTGPSPVVRRRSLDALRLLRRQ